MGAVEKGLLLHLERKQRIPGIMSKRETSSEIDQAAARWAARLDLSPLDDAQQRELDDWLAGDIRRLGAFGKARAVLARTDRAKALGPDYDPGRFAAPLALSRRRVLWLSGSAIAATAVGAVGLGLWSREPSYETARGEVRLVPLEDGSVITLNTATQVKVAFSGDLRMVRLVAGEALFEVAKDAARPFVVEAGDSSVRAIGTAFTVRRILGNEVQVLVREGTVELSRRRTEGTATQAARPVRMTANMKVVDAADAPPPRPVTVGPEEVSRELAWREGKIAFNGVTLAEAARQFARYSDTPIILDGNSVADRRVTGLYSATNPEGFANAVATVLDLNATVTPQGVVISEKPI